MLVVVGYYAVYIGELGHFLLAFVDKVESKYSDFEFSVVV